MAQKDEHPTVYNILLLPLEQRSTQTIKKCLDINQYISLALLQIQSMPVDAGVLSPTTVVLGRPIRGLLYQMNRQPINVNNDYTY